MEAMSTHPAALEASFSADTAYFVPSAPPPELDFARWLAERTPAGAPTLSLMPPGANFPLRLPRIRPAVLSPTPRLGRRQRGSAPSVHAAYLADVEGISPRQLVASGWFSFTTERSARHHIRDGRLTASDLGAWPWAVVDGKPLPRNWWADRHFALALQEWAMGELDPVGVSVPVQRLRPRRFTASARLPVA
jgi:hypothetical protein